MKNSIFISYRVSDTGDVVGRIYDYMVSSFGEDHVFKDVQKIPLGLDYREVINDALSNCRVMLVVIGSSWLTVTDDAGNRRLEQLEDWVRLEIETALSKNIPVIPLRVKGTKLPPESELPKSIKELAYRNATEIRLNDPDFGKDMIWLVESISGLTETSTVDTNNQQVVLENLTPNQLDKALPDTRREFYIKQLAQKNNELAAIESQLQGTLSAVDELKLNNQAEVILKKIEELEVKLKQ